MSVLSITAAGSTQQASDQQLPSMATTHASMLHATRCGCGCRVQLRLYAQGRCLGPHSCQLKAAAPPRCCRVQLRLHAQGRCLGPHSYQLKDGTYSYFYSTEDLSQRATEAGFTVEECSYVCVINHNRKTGQQIRRVFVHGAFRKP